MEIKACNRVIFSPLAENEILSRCLEMTTPTIEPINNRTSLVAFSTPAGNYERVVRRGYEFEALDQLVGQAFDMEVG